MAFANYFEEMYNNHNDFNFIYIVNLQIEKNYEAACFT